MSARASGYSPNQMCLRYLSRVCYVYAFLEVPWEIVSKKIKEISLSDNTVWQ